MAHASNDASPVAGRMRGSNQSSLRAHNERAVLSLIRRHGELAKADIARHTGLSAQTASVIMRSLEAENLVLRDQPRRGRVGQPSVPMRLNPDGAFSLGLKIGRRSSELVLMDFVGTIRARLRRTYAYPRVEDICDFTVRSTSTMVRGLAPALRSRLTGLGVAMPFELWSWAEEIGAPPEEMAPWRDFDAEADLASATGLSIHIANDGTGACAAENVFGDTDCADFVYFFIGAFAGGGLVLGGDLVPGRLGNAGALGSLPIPRREGGAGQLIHFASIQVLESLILKSGGDPLSIFENESAWDDLGAPLDSWIEIAGYGLAHAILSACAMHDFEAAIIDGGLPRAVLARLVERTGEIFMAANRKGLSSVEIRGGSVGPTARSLGAASLPLFARFLLDQRSSRLERS